MKKSLFILCVSVLCTEITHAQYFLGLRGSAYGGVTNVEYNPAIADNRYVADINIIGLAATVNNNYVGIAHQALTHPSLFSSTDFQDLYMHERVNGKNKNAFIGGEIQGPLSFMLSFGPKKKRNLNAIAFTYHLNAMGNADHVDETLARIGYYGLGTRAQQATHFIGQTLTNASLSMKLAAWTDFGITYSRVIIDNKANMLKVGGTLKLLLPIEGGYGYVKDLTYKWPEFNQLSIYNTQVNYAYSPGLITSSGNSPQIIGQDKTAYLKNALGGKNGVPTIAADLGFVYEWRPEKDKYSEEMDCQCQWTNDKNHYKVAIGASIVDIGGLRFKRGQYSENFYADVRDWNVGGAKFPNGIQSFDDTVHSRFVVKPGGDYFTVWLPTRLNIFLDYNIWKDFGVLFSTMISPNLSPQGNMLHQITTFTINPKYDHKWFGVYLPVSYDVNGNFSMGLTLRAGPLIIGTQDLLGLFAKKYVYNADIHAALKITIPNLKKCGGRKSDVRFLKHTII